MKARAHFQERCHTPAQADASGGRMCDPCQNLEQSALTGTVVADECKGVAASTLNEISFRAQKCSSEVFLSLELLEKYPAMVSRRVLYEAF